MLTVISGNNRNGYPCALNKVGDIFKPGIPPFETEGLADLGEASQKEAFPLAGLRGQMLGPVKVTASKESKTYAGVTVSMTSEDSAGYANLSSSESGSTKYHQHRSTAAPQHHAGGHCDLSQCNQCVSSSVFGGMPR